jgi:hypothetical protein
MKPFVHFRDEFSFMLHERRVSQIRYGNISVVWSNELPYMQYRGVGKCASHG